MAGGSGETKDHGREAHLRVKLLKVNKSSFEKTKSKNFKKKWVDPRLEMVRGG